VVSTDFRSGLYAYLYLQGWAALVSNLIELVGMALAIRSRGGDQGLASELLGVTVGRLHCLICESGELIQALNKP
jgi:hypothetical protein